MPSGMHSDRAPELVKGEFSTILWKYRISQTTIEPNSPWQNRTEGQGVKPIKNLGTCLIDRNDAPLSLWDYAFEHAASIMILTCKPHLLFGERTRYQIVTQTKPNTSEYATFPF